MAGTAFEISEVGLLARSEAKAGIFVRIEASSAYFRANVRKVELPAGRTRPSHARPLIPSPLRDQLGTPKEWMGLIGFTSATLGGRADVVVDVFHHTCRHSVDWDEFARGHEGGGD